MFESAACTRKVVDRDVDNSRVVGVWQVGTEGGVSGLVIDVAAAAGREAGAVTAVGIGDGAQALLTRATTDNLRFRWHSHDGRVGLIVPVVLEVFEGDQRCGAGCRKAEFSLGVE